MARSYWPADEEVKPMAQEKVIPEWHPHLGEFQIQYIFSEDMKTKGKTLAAKIKIASPMEKFLSEADILLVVNADVWKRLNQARQLALLDHEFHHVDVVEDKFGRMELRGRTHDIEEFTDVLRRHGAWDEDLEEFCAEAKQLDLPMTERTQAVLKRATKALRDADVKVSVH